MHVDPTRGRVRDIMTAEVITVTIDALLADAADLLDRFAITGMPVVDEAGRIAGVVTQTDLIRVRLTGQLWARWPLLAVGDVMTRPALSIADETPIEEAARQMVAFGVHRLVVVDDSQIAIGIVSTTDLVRAMAGRVDR